MKHYMKQGWRLAVKHFYIVILFFLYQLLWGFFLYRFIDSIVTPLLKRFPESPSAVRLFFNEAQFQLLKTDLVTPYLWLLGGLLVARILLTPLFDAGLYYSLHHATDAGGTQFMQGIRKAFKPIALLYWLKTLLVLAPAWWLLPKALQSLLHSSSTGELLLGLLPAAAGWLLWGLVLHLLFLAMQLGTITGHGPFQTLWHALRHMLPYAGVSLLMWAIGAGVSLFVTSISLVWAGLLALILHQGYNLIRSMMKVWTVASQYECLQSKQMN